MLATGYGSFSSRLMVGLLVLFNWALEPAIAAQAMFALHADMTFLFVCERQPRAEVERQSEAFLKQNGFRVLNLADVQHRHGFRFMESHLVALDRDQRMVEIMSVPSGKELYSFALYSMPPTEHSTAFEGDALRLASGALGCENRQIDRHENGPERRPFFESEIRRVERLFEQADRLNGERRI
ncbi:hypothetical protein [Bradyrhizobium sp. WSM1743]|uniref:hypothetical protein n=1 Tax=Bradyrhizobium sp. WSM1743 TaxID=318996 RepID=UPI0012ECB01F|nr:hypothetical protein [Bradyrhizobium sp. WSM1743]